MTRLRQRLRLITLLVLADVGACYSPYLQAGTQPAALSSGDRLMSVQIGRKDGRVITLLDATLKRDTLWGRVAGDGPNSQVGVALTDVEWSMVKASHFDGKKNGDSPPAIRVCRASHFQRLHRLRNVRVNLRSLTAAWRFPVAVLVSGCAFAMHGHTQQIGVSSSPYRAKVTIDGSQRGTTPVVVALSRSSSHVIKVELDGYQPYEVQVRRTISGWVVGNAIGFVFGLGGLAVDAVTGAVFNLSPDQLTGELAKRSATGPAVMPNSVYVVLVGRPDSTWRKIATLQR